MKLESLVKIKKTENKRLGRGIGSGKGKQSGRGSKGQKARGKIPASFSGGGLPLYKKLPYRKGLGNTTVSEKPIIITFEHLNLLKPKSVVSVNSLIESGVISSKKALKHGVKVLAKGELKNILTVEIPVSKSVREQVEKIGGKVVG